MERKRIIFRKSITKPNDKIYNPFFLRDTKEAQKKKERIQITLQLHINTCIYHNGSSQKKFFFSLYLCTLIHAQHSARVMTFDNIRFLRVVCLHSHAKKLKRTSLQKKNKKNFVYFSVNV